MNDKVISVLIPVFGGEKFIARAIESVLGQTYPFVELIIVDDGSPDNSSKIIERYTSDPRISYIRQSNLGVAAARNAALAIAKGDFIGLCDQDDEWLPQKAEKQIALFEADPSLGLIHGDVDYIDARGEALPHDKYFPAAVAGRCFARIYLSLIHISLQ